MAIEQVKVRAKISMGSLEIVTPYIQSFNVTKTRGQSSTFSASLKVAASSVGDTITGSNVVIEAGTKGYIKEIFTGIVLQAKISPCWDDPQYVILSISGSDVLALLTGKKYTRRCRGTRSTWITINGVVRKGLKSAKFGYANSPPITMDHGEQEKDKKVTNTKNSKDTKTAKIQDNVDNRTPNLGVRILTDEEAGGTN